MRRLLVASAVAAVTALVPVTGAGAETLPSKFGFQTSGRAAYCIISEGRSSPSLSCWTPRNGFKVSMNARGAAHKRTDPHLRGYRLTALTGLRFGKTWRESGYTCTSRRSGLTCRNRSGHGWVLGRHAPNRIL